MSQSRGLFLDLDGTLADSLGVMRAVYGRFLEGFSRPASDGEFASLNGPPLAEVVRRLAATHGLERPLDDLLAAYRRLIVEAYDSVAPMPGAMEVLEAARRHAWTVGVVTSNGRETVRGWLARAGLAPLVEIAVTGEDVVHGKPAPDPYRVALQRGRCEAGASIAVEDSPQGARAAVAAGLRTFGLGASTGAAGWPDGVLGIARLTQLLPHLEGDDRV